MFLPTILALSLSTLAAAAPAIQPKVRQNFPTIPVTFFGAADASYEISVLGNAQNVTINNPLSVTSISMIGRASFVCWAYGADGSFTQLVASQQHVPVNPPQTQVKVACSAPPF